MSIYSDDADRRAKEKALEIEALRILRVAQDAGIPDDCLDAEPNALEPLLSVAFYDHIGLKANQVAQDMFSSGWQHKPTRMIIAGGSIDERERVANLCLGRVVMSQALWDGVVIKRTALSQVIPILNSFESSRFPLTEEMSSCAVLLVSEVPPTTEIEHRNDFSGLMEMVMANRREAKLPTVFTLSDPDPKKYVVESLGRLFADAVKTGHVPERNIWRLSLI
jgi:hypothetical protein